MSSARDPSAFYFVFSLSFSFLNFLALLMRIIWNMKIMQTIPLLLVLRRFQRQ